jgi:hypothetical protein
MSTEHDSLRAALEKTLQSLLLLYDHPKDVFKEMATDFPRKQVQSAIRSAHAALAQPAPAEQRCELCNAPSAGNWLRRRDLAGWVCDPCYAEQIQPAPAPSEPAGWKLVPIEPTRAMIVAACPAWKERPAWTGRPFSGRKLTAGDSAREDWAAMIAAAPPAPEAAAQPDAELGAEIWAGQEKIIGRAWREQNSTAQPDSGEALADLPPLPEPEWRPYANIPMFTADQMRAYARAALASQPQQAGEPL